MNFRDILKAKNRPAVPSAGTEIVPAKPAESPKRIVTADIVYDTARQVANKHADSPGSVPELVGGYAHAITRGEVDVNKMTQHERALTCLVLCQYSTTYFPPVGRESHQAGTKHYVGPVMWREEDFSDMQAFQRDPFACPLEVIQQIDLENGHRGIASNFAGSLRQQGPIANGTVALTIGGNGQPTAEFWLMRIQVALDLNLPISPFSLALVGVTGEPGNPAYAPTAINFTPASGTRMVTFWMTGFSQVGSMLFPAFLRTSPAPQTLVGTFTSSANGATAAIDPLLASHANYRETVDDLISGAYLR